MQNISLTGLTNSKGKLPGFKNGSAETQSSAGGEISKTFGQFATGEATGIEEACAGCGLT